MFDDASEPLGLYRSAATQRSLRPLVMATGLAACLAIAIPVVFARGGTAPANLAAAASPQAPAAPPPVRADPQLKLEQRVPPPALESPAFASAAPEEAHGGVSVAARAADEEKSHAIVIDVQQALAAQRGPASVAVAIRDGRDRRARQRFRAMREAAGTPGAVPLLQ